MIWCLLEKTTNGRPQQKFNMLYIDQNMTFLSVDILLQQTNFVGKNGLKKNKRAPAC